jgi:hypothetical protein
MERESGDMNYMEVAEKWRRIARRFTRRFNSARAFSIYCGREFHDVELEVLREIRAASKLVRCGSGVQGPGSQSQLPLSTTGASQATTIHPAAWSCIVYEQQYYHPTPVNR